MLELYDLNSHKLTSKHVEHTIHSNTIYTTTTTYYNTNQSKKIIRHADADVFFLIVRKNEV